MKLFDVLNVSRNLLVVFAVLLFAACSDYEEDYEERYGWLEEVPDSSSSSSSTVKDGSEYDPVTETLKDLRDGKTYKTVKIGTQVWMAENLNYDYNEGTAKSYVNKEYPEYGRYYTWAAAMDSAAVFSDDGKGCGYGKVCSPSGRVRGVCPEGWHLPSNDEWEELFTAVGGSGVAGKKLKAEYGWSSGGNGTDAYGFSALPAGSRGLNGDFYGVGNFESFWSSSEDDSYGAYYMRLYYSYEGASLNYDRKYFAYSVRCFQDSNESTGNTDPDQESSSSEESSSSSSSDLDQESSSSSIEYGTLVDERDGQTYKTVKIGTQVWMAENLNYDYNEGTAKSYVNEEYPEYGRYYTWAAAMDSAAVFSDNGTGCGYGKACSPSGRVRGVCPAGWHLPSNDEWEELFAAVGGREDVGRMLKSKTGWYDGGNGTNEFGFSALPAGDRDDSGDFDYVGSYAYFWSSSEGYSNDAYYMFLYYSGEYAYLNYYFKDYAYSVRCFQD